jgi:parallel beta-helix repeat protein
MKKLIVFTLLMLCAVAGQTQTRPSYLQLKDTAVFDARTYGAKGDGVTDDTVAIQAAIDAAIADGGGTVILTGRHVVGTTLGLDSDVTLQGGNSKAALIGDGNVVLSVKKAGGAGGVAVENATPYFLPPDICQTVATATVGASSIVVDSAAALEIGDQIALWNQGNYDLHPTDPNNVSDPGRQVEVFTIVSIVGTTVGLDRAVAFEYPVGDVYEYNPRNNIVVRDITIEATSAAVNAIYLEYTADSLIDNVRFSGDSKGVFMSDICSNITVSNCTFDDMGESCAIGARYSSFNIKIVNNNIVGGDFDDAAILVYAGSHGCVVQGNSLLGVSKAGIYGIVVHMKSYNNVVTGNSVAGFYYGIGSLFGAFKNTYVGNSVRSCKQGIYLSTSRNETVSSNVLFNCGTGATYDCAIGIRASGGTSEAPIGNSDDIVISGNQITQTRGNGVLVYGKATNVNIDENCITNTTNDVILIQVASTSQSINYINITNNSLKYFDSNGIVFNQTGQGLLITGNTINAVSALYAGDGMQLTATPFARISNNTLTNLRSGIVPIESYCSYITDNNISDVASCGIDLTRNVGYSQYSHLRDNTIASAGLDINGLFTSTPAMPAWGGLIPNGFIIMADVATSSVRTVEGWRKGGSSFTTILVSEGGF